MTNWASTGQHRAPDVGVAAQLDWNYGSADPAFLRLYERAKNAQWNAATDVDWSIDVPFGSPLPDDSPAAMRSFAESPLAARGRQAWDEYRWELQAYMISQFLHGEQGALVVAGRLVEIVPSAGEKLMAASQAGDEARHVEVFSRYLHEKVADPYPPARSLVSLLDDIVGCSEWDITALGMQIIVEGFALAAFRLADGTFHDGLIRQISRLVARDEARHVSFGVLSLNGLYDDMTSAERATREELVLAGAEALCQRLRLEQVWDRLDVPVADGGRYSATDPLMVSYRRTIFSRVVIALRHIGLATRAIWHGLDQLGLLNARELRLAAPVA